MAKSKKAQRVIKVSGFVVFEETDAGFNWGIQDLAESLSGLEELSLVEIPGARRTKKGIRTDVVE